MITAILILQILFVGIDVFLYFLVKVKDDRIDTLCSVIASQDQNILNCQLQIINHEKITREVLENLHLMEHRYAEKLMEIHRVNVLLAAELQRLKN